MLYRPHYSWFNLIYTAPCVHNHLHTQTQKHITFLPSKQHRLFFRPHYGPGVDSASNRNEYQQYFLGGKGGWCVKMTILPPSCVVVMKSGNFNFLESSGPLQACNGTALPLPLPQVLYPSGPKPLTLDVCIRINTRILN